MRAKTFANAVIAGAAGFFGLLLLYSVVRGIPVEEFYHSDMTKAFVMR